MILPRLVAIVSVLFLLLPALSHAQSNVCRQYLMRWADDLGYGLPEESTVWGLGGGRVLIRVAQHIDAFIALYQRPQAACR